MRGVPRWSETSQRTPAVVLAAAVPHASTSTSRLRPAKALLITTRTFEVVMGAKLNFLHTLSFPVTLPPGTVAHCEPVQYCTP